MNTSRFDRISKLFAERRMSRRTALATGATSLAAAGLAATGLEHLAAQDATPEATPGATDVERRTYLFVQSFQSGSIVPTEGAEGRYTVTLEQGLGQTIYFADRPSRDVGATPTPQFLEGLGFPEDNPPNAALLLETEPGTTDIAVVELFNPSYHPATRGVTYDVAVLENWEDSIALGFQEAPADLATLAPDFGTAHLLIDDCPTTSVGCVYGALHATAGTFDNIPYCWNYSVCIPCEPYGHTQPDRCSTQNYWTDKCNQSWGDVCQANGGGPCTSDFYWSFADC